MGEIRFVRGIDEPLAAHQDGTIFVIGNTKEGKLSSGYYPGDIYVDIDTSEDSHRFHIRPSDGIYYGTPEDFSGIVSVANRVYGLTTTNSPYTYTVNGQTKTAYIPIFVIGDGVTTVPNLPRHTTVVTDAEKTKWNNKLNVTAAQIGTSNYYKLNFTKG